ncbi:MAG: tetratricopeptide repeat protein [Ginsengibacter sp.]
MKKVLLLIFSIIFFSGMKGVAQKAPMEELKKRINALPNDTARVYAYVDYAMELENIDLDSAELYYQKAAALSEQLNFYMGRIRYALNYTAVLNMQGELQKSKEISQWILALTIQKADTLNRAKAHNNLANAYNFMAVFDSAFHHYVQSANFFSAIKREEHLHILYSNIAMVLHNLLRYDKAIDYNRKSVEYSIKAKDSLQLSSSIVNLATVYSTLEQFDSTENLLKKAIPYLEKTESHYPLSAAYIALGNAQSKLKNYQKAKESFLRSIQNAQAINYSQNMAIAYNGLAMIHYHQNSYNKADEYSDDALRYIDFSQGADLLQLYKLKAGIKAKLGDHSKAYNYLIDYIELNDSIAGMSTRRNVSELEEKYQAAKKDKEILQKQLLLEESRDSLKQRNIWLFIALIVVLLSATIAFNYYRFYKQKQKLYAKELITLQQQQELERLQAGLDGQQSERKRIAAEMHDELGSGLTSILFMADSALNNEHKISENMPKIAEAARGVMDNMNEIIWSMNSEYDSLEDLVSYIRHHSVEFLSQVNMPYRFQIPDEIPFVDIPGAHRRNIHLVIKEALHNIIKHSKASMVEMDFSFDDQLQILIADDGVGINEDDGKKFGNGLKNMKRRMEDIGGSLDIKRENGTGILLSLPLSV